MHLYNVVLICVKTDLNVDVLWPLLLGGVARMTSALSEGHNSIYALTLCHYILYLNETSKPEEVGHAVKLWVGKALRCVSPQTTRHYWGLQQRCNVAC